MSLCKPPSNRFVWRGERRERERGEEEEGEGEGRRSGEKEIPMFAHRRVFSELVASR